MINSLWKLIQCTSKLSNVCVCVFLLVTPFRHIITFTIGYSGWWKQSPTVPLTTPGPRQISWGQLGTFINFDKYNEMSKWTSCFPTWTSNSLFLLTFCYYLVSLKKNFFQDKFFLGKLYTMYQSHHIWWHINSNRHIRCTRF